MSGINHEQVRLLLNDIYRNLHDLEDKLMQLSPGHLCDTEINLRRARDRYFPDGYFSDAAWDILLELDRAERNGQKYTLTDAGIDAKIPLTTSLRYLAKLERDGFIERHSDPADRRRAFVKLTLSGQEVLQKIFEETAEKAKAKAIPKDYSEQLIES